MTPSILPAAAAASSSPSSSSSEALGLAKFQSNSHLCQLPPMLFINRILRYLPTEDLAHLRSTCRMIAGADTLENGRTNNLSGMVEGEFASRITFNGPRGPLLMPTSLDTAGSCVSYEAFMEMVESMVPDVCRKVQRLPSDLVNKLISAVKQQMATEEFSAIRDRLLHELKTTGKYDEFIQSLSGLTSEEQAQCQEIVEDLFKKFELLSKAQMFLRVFGFVEAERFLESQAKQLEEFQSMGLSSEDLSSFFASRKIVEESALFEISLVSLIRKVSQEIYRMSPWIKSYMSEELFAQLFNAASTELMIYLKNSYYPLFLSTRERSCARAFSFPIKVSDHDIPSFLGSLLLSGLYTRQQIQEVVSFSSTINSNWTKDQRVLIRVTELAKHPARAEILLSNNAAVEAETIAAVLRIKTLTPEIVSNLLKGLIHSFPKLTNEDRIGFIKQLLDQHVETIPTALLREIFWKPRDPSVRELVNQVLSSRETSIRSHGRELLHTACAISHASSEVVREVDELVTLSILPSVNSIGPLRRMPIVGFVPISFHGFAKTVLASSTVAISLSLFLIAVMNAGNQDL